VKLLFCILLLCTTKLVNGQVFTQIDSIQLNNANIWGVVFDEGDSLAITTTQSINGTPHIYLRKVDFSDITQQSTLKQLTFDADFSNTTNLTDHKSLILNNEIFVAFSTIGDQDLFLLKTDINGNRIGNIITVVSGSTDPTNDMILTTDSTYIYVLHFSPPFHHHVYKFDTNLNPVGSPSITTTNNHNNIGQALFLNNEFNMFTGGGFGANSGILLTKWDNNWSAISTAMILPPVNNEGNWFSTGAVFDNVNNRWYLAFSHLESGQTLGQEHIDLAAFDNNFNLIERLHVTGQSYYRPHLALKNNMLSLSFDASGAGVFLIKYQLQTTSSVDEIENTLLPNIHPNPATNCLNFNNLPQQTSIKIYNQTGQMVYSEKNFNKNTIDITTFNTGLYFVLIQLNNQLITKKIIKY
jgi:hypothetical protein